MLIIQKIKTTSTKILKSTNLKNHNSDNRRNHQPKFATGRNFKTKHFEEGV